MTEHLFIPILNMSLTGSFVILSVLIMRIFLQKAPSIFSYCLWAVVLFRLVCPVSFTAAFSPLNALPVHPAEHGRIEYISEDILQYHQSETQLPAPEGNTVTGLSNQISASETGALNNSESILRAASITWLTGIIAMVLYSVITLTRLKKKLKTASWEKDNIYITEAISTPFVIGLIHPRIYLPATLTENEMRYILLHEQIHLKRGDHVVKIISFAALCLHWFNPLVWMAFFLSGKDMEMSCDEAVIRRIGNSVKKEYTTSLLCLSTGKRIVNGVPLAFGEGDTGSRIKNVLRYKKPAALVMGIVAIICVIATIVLLANPGKAEDDGENVSYQTFYGVVTDMGSGDSPHLMLVCPMIGTLEIPTAETIDTWFEPGDTRDPHELLPGDLVAVTYSPGENAGMDDLSELRAAQSPIRAESLMIMWQGISLKYLQEEITFPTLQSHDMQLTFPGGVIPDVSSATVGDILSIYREESEFEAYLLQVPESESSRLIVSTPILAIEENEYGGKMITIEITDSEASQTLSGLGFATRFVLGADEASASSTTTGGVNTGETTGTDTTAAGTGMDGIPYATVNSESLTLPLELYTVNIRSISRSARTIDTYVADDSFPYNSEDSLAFAEDCTFSVNYGMDNIDNREVSFDDFADLIESGPHILNKPCVLVFKDDLIIAANLESAWYNYGISFDVFTPNEYQYEYFIKYNGEDAFETYYSLVSTESMDISDADGSEIIEVYTGNAGDGDSGIVMFKNAAGELLCTEGAHVARAGWDNIYLGEKYGVPFIMNVYVEDRWDYGGYGYWVYRLDEKGGIRQIAGSMFDFRLGDDLLQYDDDLFKEWIGGMTSWLENSHLILSSQEGEIRTEKVSDTDRYNYDTLNLKGREL